MMQQPNIQVGIMTAGEIKFRIKGHYRNSPVSPEKTVTITISNNKILLHSDDETRTIQLPLIMETDDINNSFFELQDVTIGIQFHWERKENQRFKGSLKIIEENGLLTAINIVPLEDYLLSVISSEMKATASREFLKAHAVISRSWLLAQISNTHKTKIESSTQNTLEHIKWYDREDHNNFDVCADDHCQRYQGITKASTQIVEDAISETYGMVLKYNDEICDARFSKCCGGITEQFENVWEPTHFNYLTKVIDHNTSAENYNLDLTDNLNAEKWITTRPPAYCDTTKHEILSQVLNEYDLETQDFYRWQVTLLQDELKQLLKTKINLELGDILHLTPIERGVSGRIIKLKIEGTNATAIIGKELEIRKALSPSHLYSSAFVVEKGDLINKIPQSFTLKGAGWGHGVGLCQIGAAVMGANGKDFKEILSHYFNNSQIVSLYNK